MSEAHALPCMYCQLLPDGSLLLPVGAVGSRGGANALLRPRPRSSEIPAWRLERLGADRPGFRPVRLGSGLTGRGGGTGGRVGQRVVGGGTGGTRGTAVSAQTFVRELDLHREHLTTDPQRLCWSTRAVQTDEASNSGENHRYGQDEVLVSVLKPNMHKQPQNQV